MCQNLKNVSVTLKDESNKYKQMANAEALMNDKNERDNEK